MLRKHNKLIMLLVLVTFMFTMVASAGAATFSDVSGTSTQSAAIYRLNSLGIIDGYPDGTFGPDKTITRAEFAKIACVTAGLKSVASGMGSAASPFSDVATNHWANGWINVAAAQGFVKGDPAGTFRPEAQITQAEAITVLMRILGYNDNLPGNWPSDYIAKAANLGDLDDVTFVADQAATRGAVAIMASAVLDEYTVSYAASDNLFKLNDTTLLADNFDSTATSSDTPSLVYDLDLSGGDQAIKILDPALDPAKSADAKTIADDLANGTFKSLKLTDDCVISGATNITGVVGRYVDFITNKDGDVTYIKVRNDNDYKVITGVAPSDVDYVDANTVKINDKKYDVSSLFGTYSSNPRGVALVTADSATGDTLVSGTPTNYTWPAGAGFLGSDNTVCDPMAATFGAAGAKALGLTWGNATGVSLDKYLTQLGLQAETVDFVLDKDGNVAFISSNAWPTKTVPVLDEFKNVGVVDSVNTSTAKITFKNGGSTGTDLDKNDATSYIVVKNGVVGKLADVAANDLVWELDKYNTTMIVDMSVTKTGSLDAYTDKALYGGAVDMVDKLTVGGTDYKMIKGGGFLSTDDTDTFAPITASTTINTDFDDILGDDVTVWLSPSMTVAAVSSSTEGTSGKIYGVINDDTVNTLVNGKLTNAIEVLKADGSLATYAPDTDSEIYTTSWVKMSTDATDFIGATKALKDGTLVEISLNADGYINRINTADKFGTSYANVTGDKDNDVVTFDAKDYDANGMVVFNLTRNSDGDYQIASTSDFLDKIDGITPKAATGYFYAKDDTMKYAVISDASLTTSSSKVAMVWSKGKDSTDPYVYLMTTGDPVKYYVKDTATDWKDNTVNVYTTSSDGVKLATDVTTADYLTNGVTGAEITNISGKIITVGAKSFFVDSDTLYFDNTGDDPAVAALGDLASGDKVNIYYDGTGAVAAIEIVN